MDGVTEGEAAPGPPTAPGTSDLARTLGIRPETARRLVEAGFDRPESIREIAPDELGRLVTDARERDAIHAAVGTTGASTAAPSDSSRIVEKWVGTVQRPDRGRRRRIQPAAKDSAEVLKKWVEGDDRAMEEWIRSSEGAPASPLLPTPPSPTTVEREPTAPPRPTDSAAPAPVLEREETVVRWLTGLLDRVKSDQFDPATVIQESQELQRQLYDERAKRKQLEEQVEHVKRGSIAVIKYVRSREAKERETALREKDEELQELKSRLAGVGGTTVPVALGPSPSGDAAARSAEELEQRLREEFGEREHEYIERETELRRRIVQLEGDVRRVASEADQSRERATLTARPGGPSDTELAGRLEELAQRQRDLVARENELRSKFEEIRISAEESERRRSAQEFKERELSAYDQQLQSRRQALDIEARRLEGIRRELGTTGVAKSSEGAQLDDLRHELAQRDAELKHREALVQERLQEVERLSGQAAEGEADRLHAESVSAAQATKVRSGIRRLDDLLYGGFPPGAQILVNGPAHTGKDVLARLFSIEGLRLGIPSIWVITDKTYPQVRDDLATLYPGFADAEKKGMLRYVDLYSRSVGSGASAAGVRLLASTDKGVLDQLAQAVQGFAQELKEGFSTYRLIFESVSTIAAYLDTSSTFRFLQPFVGRRKLDGAVAYYVIDTGMHSEADLEALEHMLDGSLSLKVEQMKTFLAVRGIGDAQARTWVGYTFTKSSFNLGSFSLEHIR